MTRSFKVGDKVKFGGKLYTIESRTSTAFTLVNADRTEIVGVHKTNKRLKMV